MFARDKRSDDNIYRILFLGLTVMLCLRYGQGTDYIGYQLHYQNCPSVLTSKYFMAESTFEKGYRFLMNFFKSMGCSFEVFVFILSVFMMYMLYRFLKKYSGDRCLALLLFFSTFYLTYYFSAIRQGLAMAIFIGIAVPLAIDKKWIKYILVSLIIAQIHRSAYILLVVPFMVRFKPRTLLILALLVLGYAIIFNATGFHAKVLALFDRSAYDTRQIGWAAMVRKGVELVMVLTLYKDGEQDMGPMNILLKIYYIGVIVTMFFFNNDLILARLTIYFEVTGVVLLSTAINNVRLENMNIQKANEAVAWSYILIVVAISGFMTVKNLDSYITQGQYYNENLIRYPYITIFEKDDLYSYRTSDYVNLIHD